MSKRLGRQQKRKFREQVRRLEEQLGQSKAEYRRLYRESSQNRLAVESALEILGEHFVAFEPKDSGVEIPEEIEVYKYILDTAKHRHGDLAELLRYALEVLTLPVSNMTAVLADLRPMIHFKHTFGGEYRGYSIDCATLAKMSTEMAADYMARDFKLWFKRRLREKRARSGYLRND